MKQEERVRIKNKIELNRIEINKWLHSVASPILIYSKIKQLSERNKILVEKINLQ